MKKILVACGTGIATSTMVVNKITNSLNSKGYENQYEISQCKVAEVASKADDFDLVIATTIVSAKINTPVIQGIAFLTGIGVEQVLDEVIAVLKFN